jgi:hypothetical protein
MVLPYGPGYSPSLSSIEGGLSKTHAHCFQYIYGGYNYGKRISIAYAYSELMSLEGRSSGAHISIYRLSPSSPDWSIIVSFKLAKNFIFILSLTGNVDQNN